MVWNFTKPEIKIKRNLTLQDLKIGDKVRVINETETTVLLSKPSLLAGTQGEIIDAGSYFVNVSVYNIYYTFMAPKIEGVRNNYNYYIEANYSLDNLEKIE